MSVLFTREGGVWRPESGTRVKILSFMDLPDGWHFDQGGPISLGTVSNALNVLGLGDTLGLESNAFPGAGGEIAVAFYGRHEVFEVVVGPRGVETAFSEPLDGSEGADVTLTTYEEVYSRLLGLAEEWHSHDLSVHFISTSRNTASRILHSSMRVDEVLEAQG